MIKGIFNIVDPDEVQCEMTITMKLKEWKQIQSSLDRKYPDWKLSSMISDMVATAEKNIFGSHESD